MLTRVFHLLKIYKVSGTGEVQLKAYLNLTIPHIWAHLRVISALSNYDVMQGKVVYMHLHITGMSFITIKRNSVELFQRSYADKKNNRTDNLTDWSKTLYPPQLIAQGIKIN